MKFSLLDGDARLDKLIRLFTGKKSNEENINTYIARKRALFNDLDAGIRVVGNLCSNFDWFFIEFEWQFTNWLRIN